MELLVQTFLGALIITFSFIWITVATINSSDEKKSGFVQTDKSSFIEAEEVIEEVTYEEVDGTFPVEALRKRENVVKASFEELG